MNLPTHCVLKQQNQVHRRLRHTLVVQPCLDVLPKCRCPLPGPQRLSSSCCAQCMQLMLAVREAALLVRSVSTTAGLCSG